MGGTGSGRDVAGLRGFVPALTTFVGRAEEVEKVSALLDRYRLVTVTGPGGVGKTRLAAEVARRVAGRFADGAVLVELAAVQDPALVPAAVMTSLGAQQVPGVPVLEVLAGAVGRQQLLLVLDNCEHVLAAVAELCSGVLPAADDVRVLATSREPVGVGGETRFRLGPLAVPEPGGPEGPDGSAAVSLFTDRASQADLDFVLDGETGPLVGRLVARLDGMPLAIELAAARVEALGVAQLLDRLDDRLALLTSGDRAAAARQRSLAATVDWSYQLLSDSDQTVFRRLAVFPGPFTLKAAETVAGAGAGPAVLHLVDCSLLTPPRPGPDGRARYLMLETLRAFGLGRLAEAERADTEAALARHAVAVADQASAGLEASGTELPAARWLDAEDAVIQQAVGWALEHDRASALRLAVALAPWWILRGRLTDGCTWLRTAVGYATPGDPSWCIGQILLAEAVSGADMTESLQRQTAARDALQDQGPSQVLVDALTGRANSLMNLSRIPEGQQDADRALAMARDLGYLPGEMVALVDLGMAAYYRGDAREALAWLRQASRIDPAQVPGRRVRECQAAVMIVLKDGSDVSAAQRSCAELLASAREAGDLPTQLIGLIVAADLALRAAQIPEAGPHLREAIELALVTGSRFALTDCLNICGHLCAATGRPADALTVWAATAAWQDREEVIDLPQDVHRRQEAQQKALAALGTERVRAAEERGEAMAIETAAEYAIVLTTAEARAPAPELAQLSPREQELVTLVARGSTDAQIAGQLFISISTVRSHLDRIRDKTSCRRRADLTRLALQTGLV
jgi:non-specific serine/threonine protein kinase